LKDDQGLLEEMKRLSNELYEIGLKQDGFILQKVIDGRTQEFDVPPPYFSSNSGSVYINRNFTGQNDFNNNLNFGNRATEHTTQWISLNLTDLINVTDVGSGAPNNVVNGTLKYDLFGVGQNVSLRYRINPPGSNGLRTITITPNSSASFLRHVVSPSTITFNGQPLELTIHANEFGWLWLRIIQGGLEKVSTLYRFNYSTSNNNRNGGRVSINGFNAIGLPFPPYTVSSVQHFYSGHCGWFMEGA